MSRWDPCPGRTSFSENEGQEDTTLCSTESHRLTHFTDVRSETQRALTDSRLAEQKPGFWIKEPLDGFLAVGPGAFPPPGGDSGSSSVACVNASRDCAGSLLEMTSMGSFVHYSSDLGRVVGRQG